MQKKRTLSKQLTQYTMIAVVVTTLIVVGATSIVSWNIIVDNMRMYIHNTAKLVAKNDLTLQALLSENPHSDDSIYLQDYINSVVPVNNSSNNISLIVVCDMESTRFTHPVMERIGFHMVGGDESQVLQNGVGYTTTATGTLGESLRAFEPVFDTSGNQIGYVLVGVLTNNIDQLRYNFFLVVFFIGSILLGAGICASIFLSSKLKKELLNYEPEELSSLYLQKLGILDSITDGIIAIDMNYTVVLLNEPARKMLNIEKSAGINKKISEIFPKSTLPKVIETNEAAYDVELIVNETVCICNHIPVNGESGFCGAISIFRDKTTISQLAEQLTGINSVVDSLRANTHEFMNKLHIILGMIELGEIDHAKKYIAEINFRQQQMLCGVIKVIEDPKIAGLILGKFSICAERNIKFQLSTTSTLKLCKNKISSNALVTIIGNLLNNAIDAVSDSIDSFIFLDIHESEHGVSIIISDNGIGISDSNLEKIYEKGFSTKQTGLGLGLYMVFNTVTQLNGELVIESEELNGTTFKIFMPKGELKDG